MQNILFPLSAMVEYRNVNFDKQTKKEGKKKENLIYQNKLKHSFFFSFFLIVFINKNVFDVSKQCILSHPVHKI